jgi:hypothetical protein
VTSLVASKAANRNIQTLSVAADGFGRLGLYLEKKTTSLVDN